MAWTWLERIFGGRIIDELEAERARRDEAVAMLAEANNRITELEENAKDLVKDYAEIQDELGEALGKVEELEANVTWYQNRINGLEEALAASIEIPDIAPILTGPTAVVEPYEHPELGRTHNHKMVYDLEVGDLEYLTWSKAVWMSTIDAIQPEVKRVLGKAKIPITDCENFAATMVNFMSHAFRKAGLDKQGAVFLAWNYKHAYCGFVDLEGGAWIFDPMRDNYMIGELGQPLGEMYITTDIWFQG